MVIGFLFLVRVSARGSGHTPNFDTGTLSLVHVDFKVSQPVVVSQISEGKFCNTLKIYQN